MKKHLTTLLLLCLGGWLTLSACRPQTPTPPTATVAPHPTATPGQSVPPTVESNRTLLLWLPPAFDPHADTPAGALLRQQLDAFTAANPDVRISVRLKTVGGPGGLLDALITSDAAAPAVLPDLIALPQDLLREAAQRQLLREITLPSREDWYPFTRQLGQVNGQTLGIPFAADAMVLVSPLNREAPLPTDWVSLTAEATPIAFPAADPRALTVVLLYRAAGGSFTSADGTPSLNEDALRQVFQMLQQGRDGGVFPHWLTQYNQDALVWQALLEGHVTQALVWASYPLQPDAPRKTLSLPFGPDGNAFTLTTGWVWAFPIHARGDATLSYELATYLTAGDFLGRWLRAIGYLPPHASALAAWGDANEQALAAQVGLVGESLPEESTLSPFARLLSDATVALLKGQVDAAEAVQSVLNSMP